MFVILIELLKIIGSLERHNKILLNQLNPNALNLNLIVIQTVATYPFISPEIYLGEQNNLLTFQYNFAL